MMQNPYSAGGQSEHLIERAVIVSLGQLIATGRTDRGLVLLGGPGSGKTTALMQLERFLQQEGLTVYRFSDRETTEDACHSRVCRSLGAAPDPNCTYIIEQWLRDHPEQRLVLLFDEFGAQLPDRGRGFFNVI